MHRGHRLSFMCLCEAHCCAVIHQDTPAPLINTHWFINSAWQYLESTHWLRGNLLPHRLDTLDKRRKWGLYRLLFVSVSFPPSVWALLALHQPSGFLLCVLPHVPFLPRRWSPCPLATPHTYLFKDICVSCCLSPLAAHARPPPPPPSPLGTRLSLVTGCIFPLCLIISSLDQSMDATVVEIPCCHVTRTAAALLIYM